MEEVTSGTHGDTPHTSKSPRLLRSLAKASRSSRLPATRKTEILALITIPQEGPSSHPARLKSLVILPVAVALVSCPEPAAAGRVRRGDFPCHLQANPRR